MASTVMPTKFKYKLIPILHKYFQKNRNRANFQTHSMKSYYPITKTKERWNEERKLHVNISYEYRCKTLLYTLANLNQATY